MEQKISETMRCGEMLYHMYTCTINVYKSIYVCYTQNSINVTIISTRSLSFGHHRRLQHFDRSFCVCVRGGGGGGVAVSLSHRERKKKRGMIGQ